jgi:hypothetical protein
VRIRVAEWEFGCCAPPPVIGAPTTWGLRHEPAGGGPGPLLDEEHEWWVEHDGLLRRGAVVARPGGPGPAPAPGPAVLRGSLRGSVHVDPEECPRVTGRVERMRLLRRRWSSAAAPGSLVAQDVAEYALDVPAAPGDGGDVVGVLLDVALP